MGVETTPFTETEFSKITVGGIPIERFRGDVVSGVNETE